MQLGQSCPKLKRGNGTWANHGTWAYAVGVVDINGKRSLKRKAGFATKDEAQDALDKVRAHASRGFIADERLTVEQYLTDWIAGKTDIKENTRQHYERYIEKVFIPHLGTVKLTELRPAHVNRMFETLRSSPQGLNAPAAQRMRAVLRSALTDALRADLVTVNAAALAKVPGGRSPRALVWTKSREDEWRRDIARLVAEGHKPEDARGMGKLPSTSMVWTPTHVGKFLANVGDDPLYFLFWLVSHTGMRRGEVCALRYTDVNDDATITVERQLINTLHGVREDTPKTDASCRRVAIGEAGVELLEQHRERQARTWIMDEPPTYLFCREDGRLFDPIQVTKRFKKLAVGADLPPIRFHDLRHTAASMMLASGLDMKTVSTVLGHSDITITANIYTSVYEDATQAAVTNVAALIRAHNVHTQGDEVEQ